MKTLGIEANVLYQAFSGKETPSALINRLEKSKDEQERALARQLVFFFANIRSSLSDFREGKVAAKVFMIGTTVMSVTQNAHGRLSLTIGKTEIPIERNAGILSDIFGSDILTHVEIYGKKAGDSVIRKILKDFDNNRGTVQKRQFLMDYLAGRTKYPVTILSNFRTDDIANMIRNIWKGKHIVIIRQGAKFNRKLTDNDVVYVETLDSQINISETMEVLKQAKENHADVMQKVTIEKNIENEEEAEKQKGNIWNEKEQKVMSLLGDILFSYETWIADEQQSVQKPGERMRLMLIKNADAVAELVADLYKQGGDKQAFINGIVEKLPLFELEKNYADKFKSTLTETLSSVMKTINDQVAEVTSSNFPKNLSS